MEFGTAFLLGLMGSLHCVGMCGPIAMALPLTTSEKREVFIQSFLYQLGRVFTYALLGLIIGLLGLGVFLLGLQQSFSIIFGVLLILSGLFSLSLEGFITNNSFFQKGFDFVKSKLGTLLKIQSRSNAFKVGFFNGFLPCGMVYIALTSAMLSGGVFEGTLYMTLFGLGTMPLMMGVTFFGNRYRSVFIRFQKMIPYALVLLGVFFIVRGINIVP